MKFQQPARVRNRRQKSQFIVNFTHGFLSDVVLLAVRPVFRLPVRQFAAPGGERDIAVEVVAILVVVVHHIVEIFVVALGRKEIDRKEVD